VTIQKSIQRLKELEEMAQDGRYEMLPKKEVIKLERERRHLEQNLAGIKEMPGLPDAIFVIDSNKEQIAVLEANKLGIPVVAVVDTNCDPDLVTHVIPGNDDALRAIRLFVSKVAEAVLEGKQQAAEAALVEGRQQADEAAAAEGAARLTPETSTWGAAEDASLRFQPRKGPATESEDNEGDSYNTSDIPATRGY
jgi:small subunit ribosomal protein S2